MCARRWVRKQGLPTVSDLAATLPALSIPWHYHTRHAHTVPGVCACAHVPRGICARKAAEPELLPVCVQLAQGIAKCSTNAELQLRLLLLLLLMLMLHLLCLRLLCLRLLHLLLLLVLLHKQEGGVLKNGPKAFKQRHQRS